MTDIEDRKRAEEALRESEYEARLIVDSIPGLVAALNVNGEIERVNQPCLDYCGRSQEELRSMGCRQYSSLLTIALGIFGPLSDLGPQERHLSYEAIRASPFRRRVPMVRSCAGALFGDRQGRHRPVVLPENRHRP